MKILSLISNECKIRKNVYQDGTNLLKIQHGNSFANLYTCPKLGLLQRSPLVAMLYYVHIYIYMCLHDMSGISISFMVILRSTMGSYG